MNLSRNVICAPHLVCASSQTSSTATIYGNRVDMANADGCMFVALLTSSGNTTASITNKMIVYQTNTTEAVTTTNYTAISGTSAYLTTGTTAAGQKLLVCDVYRPRKRYLSARVTAGKGQLYYGVSVKYGVRVAPTTNTTAYESNRSVVMSTA
jgi:hypothetical protein